jgi:prephenate dehydrogenase
VSGGHPTAVVVGGAGAVGRMFARALAPTWHTVCIDLERGAGGAPGEQATADVTSPSPEALALLGSAQVVLLALPEAAALDAVGVVAGAMRPGALLADTCSAKTRLLPVIAACAQDAGLECVSLNPMFAPELGLAGRAVVLVAVDAKTHAADLVATLEAAGARLVGVSVDDYAKVAAAVQVATHAAVLAFGAAVRRQGIGLDLLARAGPPPFQTMLALLARIVSGQPAVYHDIQAAGTAAAAARDDLVEGIAALAATAEDGGLEKFTALLDEIAEWMGPHRDACASRCATIFSPPASPPTTRQGDAP